MQQLLFFAGAHERFLAHMIDNVLVFIFASALVTLLQAEPGPQLLVGFLGGMFYYTYFQSGKWQATPGMRVLGIRLIRLGAPPTISPRDAVMRYLCFMGPLYPFYVSFLEDELRFTLVVWLCVVWYGSVLIRLDRAGLHDIICKMRVVRGKIGV